MIAKPVAMPGTCGATSPSPSARIVEQQQRPQAVEQQRAGALLGQRRRRLRAREQARDRRVASPPGGRASAPISAATSHQPAIDEHEHVAVSLRPARERRSRRRAPSPSPRTAGPPSAGSRRSARPLRRAARSSSSRTPSGPSTSTSAACSSSGGVSSERTPTQTARAELALLDERVQPVEGVDVGAVVADVERGGEVAPAEQAAHAAALVDRDRRADLEHLAPPVDVAGPPPRRARRRRARPPRRRPRRARRASGRRRSPACPRRARAGAAAAACRRSCGEAAHGRLVLGDLGVDLDARRRPAAAARSRGCRRRRSMPSATIRRATSRLAAADAADDAVALGDRDELRARRLGDVRVVGVADDRRERPVDVEQDAPRGPDRRAAARAPRRAWRRRT